MVKQNNNKTAIHKNTRNPISVAFLPSALISLMFVVGSFSYLALIDRDNINSKHITSLSDHLADSQVFLLNQAIDHMRGHINKLATNPQLLTALKENDGAELMGFQDQIQNRFPLALSADIISLGPLGIAGLDRAQTSLRNNIEFDMLSRVSNDQDLAVESYSHNKHALFTFAKAVRIQGHNYAIGALLISFDNRVFNTMLSQLDTSLGKTTLTQILSREQILATLGEAASNAEVITKATAVEHWQLSFSPSQQLIDNHRHNAVIVWLLMALSGLAIAASLALAMISIKRRVQHNLDLLVSRSTGPYDFPGFDDSAGRLHRDFKKLQLAAKNNKHIAVSSATPSPQVNKADSPQPAADKRSYSAPLANQTLPKDIPSTIFRAYDIRGIADTELNDSHCYAIGIAIGSEARDQGQESLLVAADGRLSSPRIREALSKGIQASGCDVIDIGMVPSPLLYFATHQFETQSGVMITGSHNPAEYNGIKIVINGSALSGEVIAGLRDRIITAKLSNGKGAYRSETIEDEYVDYIVNDVAIAQPLKIVVDAGNGVTGKIAPRLFEELGCEVITLFCDIDGNFPNHHPDPSVDANMQDLIGQVKEHGADLGIAFDGDGDRLGIVTAEGNIVPADRLLMLLAQDVVARNPGADILFDVKCTRNLNSLISNYGGRPIMWKTGHSFMKQKMAETGALLGGEFSGHIFFKERWFGFDDGMYTAARLIEILSTTDPDLDAQLSIFPAMINTPEIKIASDEQQKFVVIENLTQQGQFEGGKINTLDGVRVDFDDGWGLVRASNTSPMLVLRFEADNEEAMGRIQTLFKDQLQMIDSDLVLDF